nr:hypothetical protein 29 [bacterium]
MSNRTPLEAVFHMSVAEISELSIKEIYDLLDEVDEHIRKSKLAKKWLKGALARKKKGGKQ